MSTCFQFTCNQKWNDEVKQDGQAKPFQYAGNFLIGKDNDNGHQDDGETED